MNRALAPSAALALPGSAAAAVAWRAHGSLHVTAIVKATFDFAFDAPMRRSEPQPVLRSDVHHDDNPARSLRFSTDLAPALTRADVLFTGSAYAPQGALVRSLPVRLAIFAGARPVLDKRLLVQDPEGLTRMPVVYERTGVGPDAAENPFGLPSTDGVACIVDPARPGHAAGFGPIARGWPVRKRLLGDVPRRVLEAPVAEIPDGFSWAYFQAAPPDQQTDELQGDEWIVLEGLHPSQPLFRTRLPGAQGAARIHGLSAFGVTEGQSLELYADTLRIEGDEQRCTVVWRGSFPIPDEAALPAVRIVAGVAVGGEALPWVDPRHEGPSVQAGTQRVARGERRKTLALSPEADQEASRRPALNFQPGPAAPEARQAPTPSPSPASPRRARWTRTLTLDDDAASRAPVLPFRDPAPPAPAAPAPTREPLYIEATTEITLSEARVLAPALPFQPGAQATLALELPAELRDFPISPSTGTLTLEPPERAPRADVLPFVPPRTPEPLPSLFVEDDLPTARLLRAVEPPAPPAPEPPAPPPAPPPEPPAPPPRATRPPAPERGEAGPWAPAPAPPAAPEPLPPAPTTTPPGASTTWKKGLYGRFGLKR